MKYTKKFQFNKSIFITSTILLVVYFSFIIIRYPLIGIEVSRQNGEYYVSNFYENAWAINSTIEIGDQIIKIDDHLPSHHMTMAYFKRIELADTITFKTNNGHIYRIKVRDRSMSLQEELHVLAKILLTITTISLAIVLNKSKTQEPSSSILIYFLLAIALCYFSASISARGDLLGRIVNTLTLPGFVILFIRFLHLYFIHSKTQFISSKGIKALYGCYYIVMLLSVISFFCKGIYIPSKTIQLIHFLILLFYLIFLLIRYYLINDEPNVQIILKIVFLGFIIAFTPFILFYAIPIIFLSHYIVSAEMTGISVIIIPVMLVYLQITIELFDIEFIFDKFKYYSLISIPFSILSVVFINIIAEKDLLTIQTVIASFLLFLMFIIFLYIKDYLDYRLSPHLFSQKNKLDVSLYSFFQKVKFENNPSTLINQLITQIKDVLSVEKISCIRVEAIPNTGLWRIVNPISDNSLNEIEAINWSQFSNGSLLKLHNSFATVIGSNERYKKIIYFKNKKNHTKLNIKEETWLESISYISSIILENNYLIEDLTNKLDIYEKKYIDGHDMPIWYSKLLFHVTERERVNLSMDIHDSVLQGLLQLIRNVDNLTMKNRENEPLINELTIFKEALVDNAHLVRETCNGLHPPFLKEEGLGQALQHLMEQTRLYSEFFIYFDYDYSIKGLSHDYEINIYRIVQELLNNANKYSHAKEVEISLFSNKSKIIVLYDDDGIGLKPQININDDKIGMFSIKERVRILNGSIEINSFPDKGLHICITI